MQRKLWITLIAMLSLSGCHSMMEGYGQEAGANGKDRRLENARGDKINSCRGGDTGDWYLADYGLPKDIQGNFSCEGDKPVLPKSCDGKRLDMTELKAYWEKYQLPVGLTEFECSTGQPKVLPIQMKAWKQYEALEPTCKDTHGKKRPCI